MGRRQVATIEVHGVNGRRYTVSGPGAGDDGVILGNSPDDLHVEAPITPIYTQGTFQEGATYLGHTVEAKDLVLSFIIDPPGNEDRWEEIESDFFACFAPDRYAKLVYITPDGESRYLEVRKYAAMKVASEKDPRIANTSTMVVTLRADWPYWQGSVNVINGQVDSGDSLTFKIENRTDRDIWLQWTLTAPGKWRVPDYLFNSPDPALASRRIICPELYTGETLTVDTYPTHERYVSANGSNIAGRFRGVDFLYPVPPHTPPTDMTVSYTGTGPGTFQCRAPENWLRPWGGRS